MNIRFWFEVMGDFHSNDLWHDLENENINLLELNNHVYVYGETNPSKLVWIILTCGGYGNLKGGEFICE